MDKTLERVLSLIPKEKNGEFKHGALKDFAASLGYKSGNIVSMWINGSSQSYLGKLPAIALAHNVSLEWLRGESEQKEKPTTPQDDGLTATQAAAMEFIKTLTDEQLKRFIAMGKAAFEDRG